MMTRLFLVIVVLFFILLCLVGLGSLRHLLSLYVWLLMSGGLRLFNFFLFLIVIVFLLLAISGSVCSLWLGGSRFSTGCC